MNPEIVRYENRWFAEAVFHANSYQLPSGHKIRLMQASYFLATCIEIFLHEGYFRLKQIKDFEDIIYLLDNRPSLVEEISASLYEVRGYIQDFFAPLLKHPDLEEGLHFALPFHSGSQGTEKIKTIMASIVEEAYSLA